LHQSINQSIIRLIGIRNHLSLVCTTMTKVCRTYGGPVSSNGVYTDT